MGESRSQLASDVSEKTGASRSHRFLGSRVLRSFQIRAHLTVPVKLLVYLLLSGAATRTGAPACPLAIGRDRPFEVFQDSDSRG